MRKAFTLIELLVVIAIIGALTAMLLPNYMSARERARDAQRKSDLRQIQKAQELYRQDNKTFLTEGATNSFTIVTGSCWSSGADCSGNIYMNSFPGDPVATKRYYYDVDNTSLTYTMCACLDNTADPDKSSGAACGVCFDNTSYDCPTGPCYIVTQP